MSSWKLRITILALHTLLGGAALAQPNGGPWQSGLRIARSTDGRNFGSWQLFQDSSGVPSAVRWKGDTMVCAFQWFREPRGAPTWDRVAVKFSYDAGSTWTEPVPIVVKNLPSGYQRPFDPTLAVVDGRLRLYFSSSDGMPTGGLTSVVNTYSAVSNDGVTYTFEPGSRFDISDRPVIDPAVIRFRGLWHFTAPIGAPQEGAYHAVSSDGITFNPVAPYPSDAQHNWTGNYMLQDDTTMRFYGSGARLWYAETRDGAKWSGYYDIGVVGGDPTVVRVSSQDWFIIFVGPRQTTTIEESENDEPTVAPNPIGESLRIIGLLEGDTVSVYDNCGRYVSNGLCDASSGTYLVTISRGTRTYVRMAVVP
ncbi:MAG: hypothetical protein RIR53_2013 [Bacteroidota bacterium]